MGDRHGDGRGLRRPLLAVHPAREACCSPTSSSSPSRPSSASTAATAGGWRSRSARRAARATARRPSAASTPSTRWRPIIADIERLNERLAATADPFLGKGTVTISEIRSTSPSLCAVADSCTIHLDRRLTHGETMEARGGARSRRWTSVRRAGATVTVLDYARAVLHRPDLPDEEVLPDLAARRGRTRPWSPACARPSRRSGARRAVGKWGFSTNGIATCGMFGVPTIGFGPGDEIYAHTPEDQCPVDHLTRAARFYAAFPRRSSTPSLGRALDERTAIRAEDRGARRAAPRRSTTATSCSPGSTTTRTLRAILAGRGDPRGPGARRRRRPACSTAASASSIFRDNSTRTRYAFRSACNLLGLATEELDESTSQIAHGETVRETAAMVGFLTEVVGIRDDIFLGEGHKYMTEVAASLEESHRAGVLAAAPGGRSTCSRTSITRRRAWRTCGTSSAVRRPRRAARQEARDDAGRTRRATASRCRCRRASSP